MCLPSGLTRGSPAGTPEEIARNPASYTGQYLKQVFDRRARPYTGRIE